MISLVVKKVDLSAFGKDFLGAHVLGQITGKGFETSYAKDLMEKAGVTFTSTSSAGIDVVVSNTFEEEVRQEQKLAGLFREIASSIWCNCIANLS